VLRAPRARGRESDCDARRRPPHRREHPAHSASLYAADARAFLDSVNTPGGEIVFMITTRQIMTPLAGLLDDDVIGACGIARLDGKQPEIGYWLGVPFWGQGYATEAARAVIDHAFGDLGYELLLGGARVATGLAPRAGEVRLPVDRRRPLSHPRHQVLGTGRPLPPGPPLVGVTQELGQAEPGDRSHDHGAFHTGDANAPARPRQVRPEGLTRVRFARGMRRNPSPSAAAEGLLLFGFGAHLSRTDVS
jgi:hypothetical protein